MSRPEDRYINLEKKILPNGRVVYKSARPRPIQVSPVDSTVIPSGEDRMDIIANNAYGDATNWWKIASANGQVNGSLHLKPGVQIIIPEQ